MAYSGKYVPVNKKKYKGRLDNITYRSLWELHIMKYLDRSNLVKRWNSEETIIPYYSTMDNKKRRYFMDFYVEYENGQVFLFEVKPKKETIEPIPPSKLTSKSKNKFMKEIYTYRVNCDKWSETVKLCNKKGWHFKIITEDALKNVFGYKGLT